MIALCVVLTTVFAGGCGQHRGGPPGGGGQGGFAFPVSAGPITRGTIADYASVTSTVTPLQAASLSSVASGTVLSVAAQIGEHVQKGELLVQIDDSTLRAQEAQQAANLAQVRANSLGGETTTQASLNSAKVADQNAQLNLRRNQQLFANGYVSQSALDEAKNAAAAADAAYRAALVAAQNANLGADTTVAAAQVQNAQAALAYVENQIAQTMVRAPFDGIVTARNVDPGSLAAPNTVLMEVSQLDPVYVNAGIASSDLQYVRVGTPIIVTVSTFPGRQWRGNVTFFNASASPGTLIYQARIRLANPDLTLRGGMVATAQYVRTKHSGVLLAPRAAVYQTPSGYAMFIIDQGKAKEVPVEVGIQNDQQSEVTGAGLKPQVMAILNHSALLQPGTPVMVLPAGPPGAGGAPGAPGGAPGQGKPPAGQAKPAPGKAQPPKATGKY